MNKEIIKKLQEKLECDYETAEMIFNTFLESSIETLENLQKAIEKNDLEEIANQAHAIKGSAANFGLDEISNIAKNIELNAKNKNSIKYLEEFTNLKNLIDELR